MNAIWGTIPAANTIPSPLAPWPLSSTANASAIDDIAVPTLDVR